MVLLFIHTKNHFNVHNNSDIWIFTLELKLFPPLSETQVLLAVYRVISTTMRTDNFSLCHYVFLAFIVYSQHNAKIFITTIFLITQKVLKVIHLSVSLSYKRSIKIIHKKRQINKIITISYSMYNNLFYSYLGTWINILNTLKKNKMFHIYI